MRLAWRRERVRRGCRGRTYWMAWHEPRRLVVTERTLHPPEWPEPLDGLRVGLMSDLHAGLGHTNPARVREAVELLNAQRPDLICLLGDYLDSTHFGKGRADPGEIAAELARLAGAARALRRARQPRLARGRGGAWATRWHAPA